MCLFVMESVNKVIKFRSNQKNNTLVYEYDTSSKLYKENKMCINYFTKKGKQPKILHNFIIFIINHIRIWMVIENSIYTHN